MFQSTIIAPSELRSKVSFLLLRTSSGISLSAAATRDRLDYTSKAQSVALATN